MSAHEPDQRSDTNDERARMERKHILVINSAPEFLDLVRELLQEERYNVTTTNLVPRTFDQIAALEPDVLLIDLRVGERTGWDLMEQLQSEAATRAIPVIVTSTEPRLLARAQQDTGRYGGDRFLAKPFDLDDLLGSIRELVGRA